MSNSRLYVAASPDDGPRHVLSRFDLVITVLLLLLATIGGTALVNNPPQDLGRYYRFVWRLLDEPVHALQAVLVLSPLFVRHAPRRVAWARFLLAGAVATLVDLDHLIAARSFSIIRAAYLPARPVTHSLLFALVLGVAFYAVTRRPVYGWIGFAAIACHVLYDASGGGTPIFWPFHHDSLPVPIAYGAIIGLYLVTRALAPRLRLGFGTHSARVPTG